MGEETTMKIRCPLGPDHKATFDHTLLILECRECSYVLSSQAARMLLRMADHLDLLVQVVEEHMESLEPSARLAALIEDDERGTVLEALS